MSLWTRFLDGYIWLYVLVSDWFRLRGADKFIAEGWPRCGTCGHAKSANAARCEECRDPSFNAAERMADMLHIGRRR